MSYMYTHTCTWCVREREREKERESRLHLVARDGPLLLDKPGIQPANHQGGWRQEHLALDPRLRHARAQACERADRPRPPPAAGSTHLTCSVVCIPRNHPSQICCRPSLLRRAQSLSRGVHRAGPAGHDDGRSPARADASHASAGLSATRPDHAKTAPHPSAPHVLGR